MKNQLFPARPGWLLPAVGLLVMAGSASAAVSLVGTSIFNAGTGRFAYNYSVTNSGTAEEIILVTFPVNASAALVGITAPAGFKLTYDIIGARVNFVLDDDDFTPQTFAANSTITGFGFDSPVGPGMVPFIASDVNQDFTGFTSAPVPEPSSLLLGALSVPLLLRRRRA